MSARSAIPGGSTRVRSSSCQNPDPRTYLPAAYLPAAYLIASAPAFATWPSCCAVPPLAPIAPTSLPPEIIGSPPSTGITPRSARRRMLAPPPARASSNTLLGLRKRAAERAFSIAISTEPSWALSIRSKVDQEPAVIAVLPSERIPREYVTRAVDRHERGFERRQGMLGDGFRGPALGAMQTADRAR